MLARGSSLEDKYVTPTHGPSPLEVFFQVWLDHSKLTTILKFDDLYCSGR